MYVQILCRFAIQINKCSSYLQDHHVHLNQAKLLYFKDEEQLAEVELS
jgi:hypothetical protein